MKEKSTFTTKARQLRDDAKSFASQRLSRGSLRLQEGAFATESEWRERRKTQPGRIARINARLNAG